MSLLSKIRNSTAWVKLTHWEFWPLAVFNIPILGIWLWFALRSRAWFFFTTVNPVIETGGVLGESKMNIYRRLPERILPKTFFLKKGTSSAEALHLLETQGLDYPVLLKPNVGERGFLVKKITSDADLCQHLAAWPVDFILQNFVDYPTELSVLYHRFPGQREGRITSVCLKGFLEVTGDGLSSLAELMEAYPRARFQKARLAGVLGGEALQSIPPAGEKIALEGIGNHCLGTTFLDANHLIDKALENVFDAISLEIEGIHYGRFDLRCRSVDDLRRGEHFRVLELNGIGSEPAHIYHPGASLWKAYKVFFAHWRIIFEIAREQRRLGFQPMTWPEMWRAIKVYRQYKTNAEKPA